MSDDRFYDSEIKSKKREIQSASKRKRDRELGDVRRILSVPEGRRLFWRLLSGAGVFRASFTLNSVQTAYNEGRRDIGLWMLEEINQADPNAFAQLQREYYSEINSNKKQDQVQEDQEDA